jgi:hypothetical protein
MQSFRGRQQRIQTLPPRLACAALIAALGYAIAAGANAASAATPALAARDFGSAPSGEIPIIFDDRTVYAKPDILKKGRVLAALVEGNQIYVPLRSMFERIGGFVSTSSDEKTINVSKNGASVSVTVGKPEVVVNGETRPLDVPPVLYHGVVFVPVRVISEALGAYVQWVPGQRVVVVRYFSVTPTAPPAPPPAMPPAASPSAAPASAAPAAIAVPVRISYRGFIQGAFAAPRNYNEFSAGKYCPESYLVNAAYVFGDSHFAIKGDFREDAYVTSDDLVDSLDNHYTRFATIDGGTAMTPVFLARQSSLDGRLEYQIAAPHVYVGLGYLHETTNYGYPNLNAVGFGLEKLPDLRPGFSLSGSAFYYPSASGDYTVANALSPNLNQTFVQKYAIVKYDIAVAIVFAHSPVYIDGGFAGEHFAAQQNAPIGQTHDGPYLGLGLKL